MDKDIINNYFGSQNGFGDLKNIAIDLLGDIVRILDEFSIDYFIISGTLLGYVRHNDIIPWDDDIDLIVDKKIFEVMPEIIKKYSENLIFVDKGKWFIKVSYNKGLAVKNCSSFSGQYNFPNVDLFVFEFFEKRKIIVFFQKEWNSDEFFPGQKKMFLNILISIPKNPDYFLVKNYGPRYMSILKSNSWNHKTESKAKCMKTTMKKYKKNNVS